MNKPKTISEFDELTLEEKGKLVFLYDGTFVAQKEYYNQKRVLYNMGHYFAEVLYDPISNNIIDIISLLPDSEKIDFYVKGSMTA